MGNLLRSGPSADIVYDIVIANSFRVQ
jgi:hypothetical protein